VNSLRRIGVGGPRLALRRGLARAVRPLAAGAPAVPLRCTSLALPRGTSTEEHTSSTAVVSPTQLWFSATRLRRALPYVRSTCRRTSVVCRGRARNQVSALVHANAAAVLVTPNPSIERTVSSSLRSLETAAHVER
jgi:hypothetical protein